jgi:hypothetical protein
MFNPVSIFINPKPFPTTQAIVHSSEHDFSDIYNFSWFPINPIYIFLTINIKKQSPLHIEILPMEILYKFLARFGIEYQLLVTYFE